MGWGFYTYRVDFVYFATHRFIEISCKFRTSNWLSALVGLGLRDCKHDVCI